MNNLSLTPLTTATTEFVAEAFGRVNLIGEHTDYNGGFVLPTAIPQKTVVRLRRRDDRAVKTSSSSMEDNESYEFILGKEKRRNAWVDYVQGTTQILARTGHAIGGFDVTFDSNVPIGSGLSSSAALEVSLIRALRQAFGLQIDDVQIAQLGQRVENEFVGAHVGIMDQMSASLAKPGEALFLDTRDLKFTRIPLPLDSLDLLVINSGIKHDHASGEYNTRRAECEEACTRLGIEELRDFSVSQLGKAKKNLSDSLFRRVRHVVTENDRVLRVVEALKIKELGVVGRLLNDSHASLRDDYQVSVPEVDALVATAQAQPEIFGARITGGGFGGSIVALAHPGTGVAVANKIRAAHARSFPNSKAATLVP